MGRGVIQAEAFKFLIRGPDHDKVGVNPVRKDGVSNVAP